MNKLTIFLCGLGLAALSSCKSDGFGHRPTSCDPDERLHDLLSQYDKCKNKDGKKGSHVLIDCDRIKNQIERLSLEFPKHVPTAMANAALSYEERDRVKAERFADIALDLQPIHPEAAILKSRISIEVGNLPAARRLLENQVQATPNHAGLRESLSAVLYMSGDLKGASEALDVAEGLGAPAWRIAFNRGLIAEKSGHRDEADKQYSAAVTGNPDFRAAQSRLAGIRAGAGYNNSAPPSPKEGGQ